MRGQSLRCSSEANHNSNDNGIYQGQGGGYTSIRKIHSNTDNKAITSETEEDNYKSFIPFITNEIENNPE